MRRKVALTAAAVAMVGTLAVGGTLAWFTDTETATNVVTTGNVDIAWYEEGPNDTDPKQINKEYTGVQFGKGVPVTPGATLKKEAFVRNEGKNDAFIRAKIEIDESVDGVVTANILDNKWESGNDGWYYYLGVVEDGADTELLIDSLVVDSAAGNSYTNRENVNVILKAEAIQADNNYNPADPVNLNVVMNAFEGNSIVDYDDENEAGGYDGETVEDIVE